MKKEIIHFERLTILISEILGASWHPADAQAITKSLEKKLSTLTDLTIRLNVNDDYLFEWIIEYDPNEDEKIMNIINEFVVWYLEPII